MTQFMTAKFTKLGGVQRPLKNRHSKSKIKKLQAVSVLPTCPKVFERIMRRQTFMLKKIII